MKKIAIEIALAAGLIGTPALAADMPVKAPPTATAVVYNWTGLYAGVNVGDGWGKANNNDVQFVPIPATVLWGTDTSHPNGVIGGGQLGYNWQTGSIVLGVETDIQGSGQRGGASLACPVAACGIPGFTASETDKLTWFGTTRGRIGVASGGWLAYVTGGAAYGGLRSTGSFVGPAGATTPFSNSATRVGWTAGGGLEATLIGNWTWKVEYLYMDFGTANFTTAAVAPFAGAFTQSLHFTDSIVRGGVNLRF
jgi:outer membrane immunogenic protein